MSQNHLHTDKVVAPVKQCVPYGPPYAMLMHNNNNNASSFSSMPMPTNGMTSAIMNGVIPNQYASENGSYYLHDRILSCPPATSYPQNHPFNVVPVPPPPVHRALQQPRQQQLQQQQQQPQPQPQPWPSSMSPALMMGPRNANPMATHALNNATRLPAEVAISRLPPPLPPPSSSASSVSMDPMSVNRLVHGDEKKSNEPQRRPAESIANRTNVAGVVGNKEEWNEAKQQQQQQQQQQSFANRSSIVGIQDISTCDNMEDTVDTATDEETLKTVQSHDAEGSSKKSFENHTSNNNNSGKKRSSDSRARTKKKEDSHFEYNVNKMKPTDPSGASARKSSSQRSSGGPSTTSSSSTTSSVSANTAASDTATKRRKCGTTTTTTAAAAAAATTSSSSSTTTKNTALPASSSAAATTTTTTTALTTTTLPSRRPSSSIKSPFKCTSCSTHLSFDFLRLYPKFCPNCGAAAPLGSMTLPEYDTIVKQGGGGGSVSSSSSVANVNASVNVSNNNSTAEKEKEKETTNDSWSGDDDDDMPLALMSMHHHNNNNNNAPDVAGTNSGMEALEKKHCEVCGHNAVDSRCSRCNCGYHFACLNLAELPKPPWVCLVCKNPKKKGSVKRNNGTSSSSQHHQHEENRIVLKTFISTTEPKQCFSCGYHEPETIMCNTCQRTFCFGCMCLSHRILPANRWDCVDCVGADAYDELHRGSVQTLREIASKTEATTRDKDEYSQLVFDFLACCNWRLFQENISSVLEIAKRQMRLGEFPCIPPFHSLHYPVTPDFNRDLSRLYSRFCMQAQEKPKILWRESLGCFAVCPVCLRNDTNERNKASNLRLRIGYLSSDFLDHPTADLILSAFRNHDVSKYDIFLYSLARDDHSNYRRWLEEIGTFRMIPFGSTGLQIAKMIAKDKIHILVNLNGHTAGEKTSVFAYRPAPVQAVYLGYPGTMGAPYIQYNIADATVVPRSHSQHYSETLVWMPYCYQVNSFRDLHSDVLSNFDYTRADFNLPEKPVVVLCNFCRLGRITEELFKVWLNILRKVPHTVLWLYKHPRSAVARLMQRAAAEIPNVSKRIIFASPLSPKVQHLMRIGLADLYLDTTIYNGHTTGSDALWAGVPMVTLKGKTWASRVGASLAKAVNLPEMIVKSLTEYEELAVFLCSHPDQLTTLRNKLKEERLRAPLFNAKGWTRSFEMLCDQMWEYHCKMKTASEVLELTPEQVAQCYAEDHTAAPPLPPPLPPVAAAANPSVECNNNNNNNSHSNNSSDEDMK